MERLDASEALARQRAANAVHGGAGADLTVPARTIEPGPGVPRKAGRGYVDSFGEDRVCSSSGCTTRLSRYNRLAVCGLHDPTSTRSPV